MSANDKVEKATKEEREYLPSFAELIDILSINQIKEVLLEAQHEQFSIEMKKIEHDIDLLIRERNVELSSNLIRAIIIIAQMNLHIWHYKDKMQDQPERYAEYLTLAHQLNGFRNQMKNLIAKKVGENSEGRSKTNTSTDDIKGWKVSIQNGN